MYKKLYYVAFMKSINCFRAHKVLFLHVTKSILLNFKQNIQCLFESMCLRNKNGSERATRGFRSHRLLIGMQTVNRLSINCR